MECGAGARARKFLDKRRSRARSRGAGDVGADRLAVELGERYRDSPPSAVFTSDLQRAVKTAAIAFGTQNSRHRSVVVIGTGDEVGHRLPDLLGAA
jgi:hypothetical protein